MLFRPVYGPELEAIYKFIATYDHKLLVPSRKEVYDAFVPRNPDNTFHTTQNIDDAIAFLKAAGLLLDNNGIYSAQETWSDSIPFSLLLLKALRNIEFENQYSEGMLNSLYIHLLTELFIKPDTIYIPNLHASANQLKAVKDAGGIGREKLQSWMRVMEYLGIGYRVRGQFVCMYHPLLMQNILRQWPLIDGTLQSFMQECFNIYLPGITAEGEISKAVKFPLEKLNKEGLVGLFQMQDSPSKPYFGEKRYRGIRRVY